MPHDWNDLSARQNGKTLWWTEVGKEEDWMNKGHWEATRIRASRVRQDGNNLVVGGLTLVRDGELGSQKQHNTVVQERRPIVGGEGTRRRSVFASSRYNKATR